jgi:hypothetical protein
LDEQLAVHITDEEESSILDELMLESVDYNAVPFDEWQMDDNSELQELLRLPNDLFTDVEAEKEKERQRVS